MPVVAGVAFNATTPDRILLKASIAQITLKALRHKGCGYFLAPELSLKYKYKERARILTPENRVKSPPKKPKPLTRWLRSLRDHNHLSAVFYRYSRQSLNRNPLASQRDPTI